MTYRRLNVLFRKGYFNDLNLKDFAKLDQHIATEALRQKLYQEFSCSHQPILAEFWVGQGSGTHAVKTIASPYPSTAGTGRL